MLRHQPKDVWEVHIFLTRKQDFNSQRQLENSKRQDLGFYSKNTKKWTHPNAKLFHPCLTLQRKETKVMYEIATLIQYIYS